MSRLAVMTLSYGRSGKALAEISMPLLTRYAQRCGARCVACDFGGADFPAAMLEKMRLVREALEQGLRILWVDLDVMIRPDAPDLFGLVPPEAFAAADECGVTDAAGIKYRHDHMAAVCSEERLPIPDSRGRYYNCGLFLAPPTFAWVFAPRRNPTSHPWVEQSVVNVRLHARHDQPVYLLPEACNRLYYHGPRHVDASWFVHFAGPPSPEQRLADMTALRRHWQC